MIEETTLPDEIGIMVLPSAILFPNALLPLYIFEPCYREMLAKAVEGDRMFGIAMPRPGADDDSICEVGGAGLIRACVGNPDGTSHLVLQGVCRVRFTDWVQTDPYRIARVERLDSFGSDAFEASKLADEIRSICRLLSADGIQFPENFESFLKQVSDPGAFSDMISSTLVPDAATRQDLLQELDVTTRLKGILATLRAHLGK